MEGERWGEGEKVIERERFGEGEGERERERGREGVCVCMYVCVSVYWQERERIGAMQVLTWDCLAGWQ